MVKIVIIFVHITSILTQLSQKSNSKNKKFSFLFKKEIKPKKTRHNTYITYEIHKRLKLQGKNHLKIEKSIDKQNNLWYHNSCRR